MQPSVSDHFLDIPRRGFLDVPDGFLNGFFDVPDHFIHVLDCCLDVPDGFLDVPDRFLNVPEM